jgi:iron complex outermembrane recepter protein
MNIYDGSRFTHAMMLLLISVSNLTAAQDTVIEEVVVLGTRTVNRSKADSPVPVDVVNTEELSNHGGGDLDVLLRAVVPSYAVDQQPISDAATMVRPANLRGLAPDHTLVLVNGKRRHRASVIAFDGSGISDGAQGPDISVFPTVALKQVEVLRDGAAAQYGSDAIAGVMNFVLKDDDEGGSIDVRLGGYSEGDGETARIAGNIGLPFTRNGFVNASFEYGFADPTDRQVQHFDAAVLSDNGNTDVKNPAMIWGAPEIKDDIKLFVNSGISINSQIDIYAFGNYAEKQVDGGFFYRAPATRGGVYTADGAATLLVGDLDTSNAINCPVIAIDQTTLLPDQVPFDRVTTGDLDSECFVFNELLPGGFTPRFGGKQKDYSIVGGLRGELTNGIRYDMSAGVGSSASDFVIRNTVNASLGPNTPLSFKPGEHIQTETNVNVDIAYPLVIDMFYSPLNIATGFEWRKEEFQVKGGDAESFATGPLASQGFSSGSNGFSGFSPVQVGVFSRKNIAFYIDLETDFTDKLLVNAALRWEDFDDFGTTLNWKLSGLYDVTDDISVRGSVSTGFRAPTPGQANIVNISTLIQNINGIPTLVNEGAIPPTNPVAVAKGGKPLAPEESTSFSIGGVFSLEEIYVTLDYFHIKIKDRISLGADISLTAQEIIDLTAAGITGAESLGTFKFYTNNFDTTTQGIDLVATYGLDWENSNTDFTFTFNWTKTTLDKSEDFVTDTGQVIQIIDDTREAQLEELIPNIRFNLGAIHYIGDWRLTARANFFDNWRDAEKVTAGYGKEIIIDAELGYDFNDNLSLVAGAQNLLNQYPDKNDIPDQFTGQLYPERSPFGFNGTFYYLRMSYAY